ncbi:MAG: penicillin-binding protein activator, partial [Gammaproteobacteria bacterium]|nr:penicillin-binding protein activator [Gammaproteobacteria bacterium]
AEAARLAGDWDGVRQALAQLAQSPPAGDQALQQRLLQAEVMLQEQRPEEAFAALGAAPVPGTPDALRIRYYRDLAATYRQLGNLLETAAALQEVDALQTERADRLATQSEILRSLALLNEQVLRDLQPSPPGVLGGWMELALLVKQYGAEPDRLQELFAQWRERFPQHPALPELLSDYRQQLQGQLQHYDQIAVLLPQSGTLANVASAIRDGILI